MRLDRLLPKHRASWILWISILVIVFPLYYVWKPYSDLNKQYEMGRWKGCLWDEHYCEAVDWGPGRMLKLDMRAPTYVADFTEMPLQVTVTNNTTETLDAIVSVQVKGMPGRGQVHLRLVESGYGSMVAEEHDVPGYFQNSAAFRDIPPHGEMVATFMMRVSGGADGEEYGAVILLDGNPITQPTRKSTFDRREVFELWLFKRLLFPPGANIFIPIVGLILVGFGEEVYERSVQRREKAIWGILLVGVLPFLALGLLGYLRWGMVLTSIVAIFVSAAAGWLLGHGGKPREEKIGEGLLPSEVAEEGCDTRSARSQGGDKEASPGEEPLEV